MKTCIYQILLFMLIGVGLCPAAMAQSTPKKQVAVYMTESEVDDDIKKVISSKIVGKIAQSNTLRALERTADFLKAIQADRDYNTSGEVENNQIAAIGIQLGAQYVAVVDVTEVLRSMYVSARLIDVESGAIVATSDDYIEEKTIQNLVKMAEKVAARLIESVEGSSTSSGNSLSTFGEVETFTVNGVSFDMVKVDGGEFMMGSYEGANDEQPVHTERVGTFYMGKTEVTQKLWTAVMGSNPSRFRGENLPVENVSWFDCQEFVERLSRLTGRIFRLPSEAEWEYASKGGSRSRNYKYSGSNDLYRVGWYNENSSGTTHPVGMKLDNELGIFDMSGNVWEWCSDNYSSSYSSPRNSPYRVYRGGSWHNSPELCRSALRCDGSPGGRHDYLGLRLAL